MSYWEDRQRQLNKALAKDEENLKKRLSKIYDAEARRLEKEIANYYQQYGRENVIEYRRLMEALPDSDKVLLIEKMDEFAEKFPEYSHLMPVRESVYKLDRLQGLQYSVIMQQLEIGAEENELIRKHLEQTASRSLETAAETMGFGSSFYAMNKDIVKMFVDVPWSNGAKFSDTIWKNKAKLYNYLNTDLAQGFARGDSYDRLAKQIRERFGKVSRNDAYRLIYTEGTYVQAEASMQPFTEDFEKYRISTVGDNKVCPICEAMAQEVFEIKDRTAGENFPPFHPWCRCTFVVVVDDWDAWKRDYMAKHGGDQAEAGKIQKNIDDDNLLEYNRNRNILKAIPRQDYTEPMTKKHVRNIMKEMGVDYGKAKIILDKKEEYFGTGLYGHTNPNRKAITFYPDAFSSREELVKTIGHEKVHLMQLEKHGPTNNHHESVRCEDEAIMSEEIWWKAYQQGETAQVTIE